MMIRKYAAVSAAVALFVLVGLFSVGAVSAQTATPPAAEAPTPPWGGAWARVCRGAGVVSDAIAELLGMTPDEILAERQDGKSLSDLAEEKGVTDEALSEAIIAARTEAIEQAVEAGTLTRERADLMLERMQEMVPNMLDRAMGPASGPAGRRGMVRGSEDMPMMRGTGPGCSEECLQAPDADDAAPQGMRGMRDMREMHRPGMRGFGLMPGNF